MYIPDDRKIVFFVSTGRCGTTRLAQILSKCTEGTEIIAKHQLSGARLANIAGNIMYYFGSSEAVKRFLMKKLIKFYTDKGDFICTDPLISMLIPKKILRRSNTYIYHIYRDEESFAKSFFQFTRKKKASFIAHNFIPFWQIGIWPLENYLFRKSVMSKYLKIARIKFNWFQENYSHATNFKKLQMKHIFTTDIIEKEMNYTFDGGFKIDLEELNVKANES